ncbi:hypothetical protein [Lentibacillus sp. CBA3610]|uniref:hypothetical protein n=1 Tax=Lentibacillus sp. CBA3610 TaxID=2518176 RepID=UPI00159606FF|nr:hypothetical protein [Lentibacillus sp. CBA3610]QKY70718.1 hypothetical protein Len3610_14955 [Lentibacillus sp. CBA3610]
MIIEMLSELFAETSPLYFYFSVFLSVLGPVKFTQFGLHKFIGHAHVSTKKSHAIQIQSAPIQESIGGTTDIMDWIVTKAKRIDAPDDDTDDHTFSFFKTMMKKRGGHKWNENLYSHLRKNIA